MELRKATMRDAKDILQWKNDPETRHNALLSHEEITWEDHVRWLKWKLQRGGIYIITENGTNYGDLRFDGNEISIRVTPEARDKGIALWAVRQAQTMYTEIVAKIVVHNLPSLNLFTHAGFHFEQFNGGHYVLRLKFQREA